MYWLNNFLKTSVSVTGLGLIWTVAAFGGIILQDTDDSAISILTHDPIGQSFTAEDPHVTFGAYLLAGNFFLTNVPVTETLYSGSGFGGAVLASHTVSPPDLFNNYYDVDFSDVTLTPGNVYTVQLTTSNLYWVLLRQTSFDAYPGGTMFVSGVPGADIRFRVTPVAAAVPEPGTLGFLVLGIAALGSVTRLRRTVTARNRS